MFSAIVLVLGALAASTDASAYLGYAGYPGFYAAPWAAGGFYRSQYHTQANYAPIAYAAAPAVTYAAAPAPAITYAAAPAPVAYKTYAAAYPAYANQYHSQNHLGEAAYGYSFPGQAHTAFRDALGGVTGSYAYVDPNGKSVQVNYRASAEKGFEVSSNNLPVAPKVDLVQPVNDLVGPAPVDYTPEVKAAREEHLKAVEAAKAQPGYSADEPKERKKRSVLVAAAPYAATPYAAYGYAAAPVSAYNYGYSYSAAPAFYSAAQYATPYAYAANPWAYNYGIAAPAVVKTEIKPLKAIEGTPASTYKFELP